MCLCLLKMSIARGCATAKFWDGRTRPVASRLRLQFLSIFSAVSFRTVLAERLWFKPLRSRLYWASSHVHQSGMVSGWDPTDLTTGEVCHRGESWHGGEMKEKSFWLQQLSVLVWRKSRHELHLSAVVDRISRAGVGDVWKWTELPHSWRDPGIFLESQGPRSCALEVQHFIKWTDEQNPGTIHYLLWSSLLNINHKVETEHANRLINKELMRKS